MANGKVVKYKKVFEIVVEGSSDMVNPESTPLGLENAERILRDVTDALDGMFVSRSVTIKEIKR